MSTAAAAAPAPATMTTTTVRHPMLGEVKVVIDASSGSGASVVRRHDYSVQKILTLNLCWFPQFLSPDGAVRHEGHGQHEGRGMDLTSRVDKIIAMLRSESPDIVLLQEGRDCGAKNRGDYLLAIAKICAATGLFPIMQHNNADVGSFLLATLFNPDKYFHQASDRFYPRSSNVPSDRRQWGDEFGNGFGRQSTVNTFYRKRWSEVRPGVFAEVPDYDTAPFVVVNQHLSLAIRERRVHAIVFLDEMVRSHPGAHVFCAGDFNPLPRPADGSVEEQMKIYDCRPYQLLTKPPHLSQHGIPIGGSFIGWPSFDAWAKTELAKSTSDTSGAVTSTSASTSGDTSTVSCVESKVAPHLLPLPLPVPKADLEPGRLGNQLDHVVYRPPLTKVTQGSEGTGTGSEGGERFEFKTYNVVGRFDGTDLEHPTKESDYFAPGDRREEFYSDHTAVVVVISKVPHS